MLEAKTLTIKKSTNKSGKVVNFVPEIVGDKEVYSILNQNNEHCGYMTEDMLNIILKMNEKEDIENNIIRNSLFVDMNDGKEEPTTLAQKIIIDKLDGKDNKILNGYNSVDEKESINMGQAINDLEIL